MIVQETTALKKVRALKKRLRIIQGGTSASKTISILTYLIALAQHRTNLSISVVSETFPHLDRGAIRDFIGIMEGHGYYDPARHNLTKQIYRFETGSYIEFFSADQPGKARGPRRDVLFINEANNVMYEIYEQLSIRTNEIIILDYNPTSEFWVHTEVMPKEEYDFLKLTYLDNEALNPAIRKSIESKRDNIGWFRVYGLGEVGIKEGQIISNWEMIDEVPEEAELIRYGVDFGFTNDPTVIGAVYKWNGGFIVREVAHALGLSNKEIANFIRIDAGLNPVGEDNKFEGYVKILTIADSAEPKSIAEIKKYGVKVEGAVKGQGSVDFGIEKLQENPLYITKSSVNIQKDLREWLWKMDKSGKSLNIPSHDFSHSGDMMRYAIVDVIAPDRKKISIH